MATPTYIPIQSTTLSSNAASVTFTNIPQNYRDLVVIVNSASNAGGVVDIDFRANGDSSSIYLAQALFGDGSNDFAFTQSNFDQANIGRMKGLSLMIAEFFDYSTTDRNKCGLSRGGSADSDTRMIAFKYASNSAITSLEIRGDGDDFASGGIFSLFGIEA